MTQNWLQLLVSRDWTAEQALTAVSGLPRCLGPESPRWSEVLREDPGEPEDDIPF